MQMEQQVYQELIVIQFIWKAQYRIQCLKGPHIDGSGPAQALWENMEEIPLSSNSQVWQRSWGRLFTKMEKQGTTGEHTVFVGM